MSSNLLKVMLCSILILAVSFVCPSIPTASADQKIDALKVKWETSVKVYQTALNRTPKDYLGAINATKEWVELSKSDPDGVKAATDGVTTEALQGVLNNVYVEVSQVLVDGYSKIESNPTKAAGYVLVVQEYFDANPEIFNEFAVANKTTAKEFRAAIHVIAKDKIRKAYVETADKYGKLIADGKEAEAKTLNDKWKTTCDKWQSQKIDVPDDFKDVTNKNLQNTVTDAKNFELDVEEWKKAVDKGDAKSAMKLVNKWLRFAKKNPDRAKDLDYIYNGLNGGKRDAKLNWEEVFIVETYAAVLNHDVKAYEEAIAKGDIKSAKNLLRKWLKISTKGLLAKIFKKFGIFPRGQHIAKVFKNIGTIEEFRKNVKAELKRLNEEPGAFTQNVDKFKKDLAEFNKQAEIYKKAEVGSDNWYGSAAKMNDLCDKWSQLADKNPSLAKEIEKATKIQLPKAADDVITKVIEDAIKDSAVKLNEHLGAGRIKEALNLVKAYNKHFASYPKVKAAAIRLWGKKFITNLENYEKGLNIMLNGDLMSGSGGSSGSAKVDDEKTSVSGGASSVEVEVDDSDATIESSGSSSFGASGS